MFVGTRHNVRRNLCVEYHLLALLVPSSVAKHVKCPKASWCGCVVELMCRYLHVAFASMRLFLCVYSQTQQHIVVPATPGLYNGTLVDAGSCGTAKN